MAGTVGGPVPNLGKRWRRHGAKGKKSEKINLNGLVWPGVSVHVRNGCVLQLLPYAAM